MVVCALLVAVLVVLVCMTLVHVFVVGVPVVVVVREWTNVTVPLVVVSVMGVPSGLVVFVQVVTALMARQTN
jgi:amino acid transporter